MQTILKLYIRDTKAKNPRTPRGIAVAIREGDKILYGFSLLNTRLDRWNKELGLKIAMARAYATCYGLPQVQERESLVLDAFEILQRRAENYFKDVSPENTKPDYAGWEE